MTAPTKELVVHAAVWSAKKQKYVARCSGNARGCVTQWCYRHDETHHRVTCKACKAKMRKATR